MALPLFIYFVERHFDIGELERLTKLDRTCKSFVCFAHNELEARQMHPEDFSYFDDDRDFVDYHEDLMKAPMGADDWQAARWVKYEDTSDLTVFCLGQVTLDTTFTVAQQSGPVAVNTAPHTP